MTNEIKHKIVELAKEINDSPESIQMRDDWTIINNAMLKVSRSCMTPEQKAEYVEDIMKEYPHIEEENIVYPTNSLYITREMEYSMNKERFPALVAKMDEFWSLVKLIPVTDNLDVDVARKVKNIALDKKYDEFVLLDGSQFIFAALRAFLRITTNRKPNDEFYDDFIDSVADIIAEM